MNRNTILGIVLASSLAALAACGGGDKSATGKRQFGISAGRKEANDVFQSLCATCHGTTGHGDGPGAAACNPKPRSYSDQAWQASVTDEQLVQTITYGGAAVGKSPQMPAQPQLKGKDDVLAGLVAIIRGFRKPTN
jgi:hypothetical protein